MPSVAYNFCKSRIVESWAADYARGGACHVTHLKPDRRQVRNLRDAGVQKLIVYVRDPRQTLVSAVHHLEMYPDQFVEFRRDADLRERSQDSRRIGDAALRILPFYLQSVEWIEHWTKMESEIQILFSTFEEITSDFDSFIERYLAFYGGNTRFFSKTNATARHEGSYYHLRRGSIDEWLEVFTKDEADYLSSLLPETLKERFRWGRMIYSACR